MALPSVSKLVGALKPVLGAVADAETPVRVAVRVDGSASGFLVSTVKEALVPRSTSALVRVDALSSDAPLKPDTDLVLVLTCGSEGLRERVQALVVAGAPVCVLCESSVEVPFIDRDTPLLGAICSTDAGKLLDDLSRWVLERTEKGTAFAANFEFMRQAQANRVAANAALTNMATGALVFVPGADFPVMTLAQLAMMLQLSAAYGLKPSPERAYEAAGVVAGGLALRQAARVVGRVAPRTAFISKALIAGLGTYAMGMALSRLYRQGVDYSAANELLSSVLGRVRGTGAREAGASAEDEAARA